MTIEETELQMPSVSRRSFIGKAGLGVAGFAASAALLAACGSDEPTTEEGASDSGTIAEGSSSDEETVVLAQDDGLPEIAIDMATSWPASLVTIFGGATKFQDEVSRLTGGKLTITARPAGEIVGGGEVLPAVRDGGAQAGHTASYYYIGENSATQFGTAVPFGAHVTPAERMALSRRRARAHARVLCRGIRADPVPCRQHGCADGWLVL